MSTMEMLQEIMQILDDMQTSIRNTESILKSMRVEPGSSEEKKSLREKNEDGTVLIDKRLDRLEVDVRYIGATLENEMNKQIRAITEGRFRTDDNGSCHIQQDFDEEYVNARILSLENEVSNLKQMMKRVFEEPKACPGKMDTLKINK